MPRGRPKVPLLSRERIIQAALAIADSDGLEALTTRRLAAELGVKGASLYNHFQDKDELMAAVAEHALTRVPTRMLKGDVGPDELLLWGVVGLRNALMAHPHLVPVLVQQRSVGNKYRDAVTARLIEGGIPAEDVMLLHEALERWALGNAVRETASVRSGSDGADPDRQYPSLMAAKQRQRATANEIFETVAKGIIQSILERNGEPPAPEANRARR